jgi:ATP phosphoribosyltransferase regulatory subunit
MSSDDRWLLPEGINESLPEQAEALEVLRRRMLDLYHSWGYELVILPFIEYLESLLTGTGHDLDLQTFKLTDQLSGRMMGVRADMTPQVARIDAHRLKRDVPTRLCYLGTVLNTRPDGFAGSRSPMQVGAELYGHAGIDSDLEVLSLMLETLKIAGIETLHIDLGHVGVFRHLAAEAGLSADQEASFFDMLQRKARPEIEEFLSSLELSETQRNCLSELAVMNGGVAILEKARAMLSSFEGLSGILDDLESVAKQITEHYPQVELNIDLAELRGYHYHTGIIFTAYVPGQGKEIARGGRYDDIGKVFGRARPATGFSTDLKTLLSLTSKPVETKRGAVFAPADSDPSLKAVVSSLRQESQRVIMALEGQEADAKAMGCHQQLVIRNGEWVLESV